MQNVVNECMKPIQVGLLGIGTVGSGTYNVLTRNQEEIRRRAGRAIEITMVADLDVARAKSLVGDHVKVVADGREIIANPDIDIVVELIGGYGVAKALVLEAIAAGKHVVTANKALLAVHGNEIFAAAREKGVMVAFEAAVAGGIPIIKALREGLTANRIEWIAGIINGTTNFILSEMRDKGLDFDVVLKEAQRLGYAEADPTFDIEGVDAAHKATIMSAIAFGIPMQFDKAHVEGIVGLQAADIKHAEALGYRIKLLGITRRRADANGIELRVHPTLVPAKRLIANVEGAMNAVVVQADAVGTTLYYGKGAGAEPTASAVVADLVDITRLHTADPDHRVPHLAFRADSLADTPDPGHRRRRHLVLPAPVRGRRGRRAVEDHHHAGRARHLHRRRAAAPQPRPQGRPAGPDHPHAQHRRGQDAHGHRADAGAADRAGAHRLPAQGRPGLAMTTPSLLPSLPPRGCHQSREPSPDEVHQHPRRQDAALLQRDPARRPGAGRRAVPARRTIRRSTTPRLSRWRGLSYAELAFEILSLYIDDIPAADLKALAARTYTAEVFGTAAIVPLRALEPGVQLEALSNGPTLAFKDMAMQLLGNLFEYELARRGETLNILGATSGDTGSAAEHAMRGKKGVSVFMLSPYGRMSPFQQAQMFSLQDANIHNLSVEGVFDDCQDIVKAVSNDLAFKRKWRIGTVNSINWARLLAQVVYYFAGYFQATTSATTRRSASRCPRATSATSAPATSRA